MHFKAAWKIETLSQFNDELVRLQVKLLPILDKLSQVQMRKEHFVQI